MCRYSRTARFPSPRSHPFIVLQGEPFSNLFRPQMRSVAQPDIEPGGGRVGSGSLPTIWSDQADVGRYTLQRGGRPADHVGNGGTPTGFSVFFAENWVGCADSLAEMRACSAPAWLPRPPIGNPVHDAVAFDTATTLIGQFGGCCPPTLRSGAENRTRIRTSRPPVSGDACVALGRRFC